MAFFLTLPVRSSDTEEMLEACSWGSISSCQFETDVGGTNKFRSLEHQGGG